MDEQIARLNIEHFKRKLDLETDEAKRRRLLKFLADEEAKLVQIRAKAKTGSNPKKS